MVCWLLVKNFFYKLARLRIPYLTILQRGSLFHVFQFNRDIMNPFSMAYGP